MVNAVRPTTMTTYLPIYLPTTLDRNDVQQVLGEQQRIIKPRMPHTPPLFPHP